MKETSDWYYEDRDRPDPSYPPVRWRVVPGGRLYQVAETAMSNYNRCMLTEAWSSPVFVPDVAR